jgi:hypothetical protein
LIKNEKTETYIDFAKLDTPLDLFLPNKFKLSGINRERKTEELILYTPEFHSTTLTNNDGIEFVVINKRIVAIFDRKGSNRIPENGEIFSASGKFREQLKYLKVGDRLSSKVNFRYVHEEPSSNSFKLRNAEDIVTGVPQLIKNGKIEITWQEEKSSKSFVETHHPRTAVAKLKDGKFLMVTVDGRSEESGGISLPDLAAFLLEMGATDAMNLDGGGSTTMFLDGKVINKPSDKEGERKVGDAILVTLRK